jgi:hypothetical protein
MKAWLVALAGWATLFSPQVLLSLSAPLSAQSLDQAASRERGRREAAAPRASKVFTEEDLQKYVGHTAFAEELSDQEPADDWSALRQTAHWRHWASAESYVRQCEVRLSAAKELWLAASETRPPGAAGEARRAVERAVLALEHARAYRGEAEMAARRAGVPSSLVR